MTPRARAVAALSGLIPDWVPCVPLVDIPQAQRRVGERLTLKGNLNTSTLVSAPPDEVYALAAEAVRQGKPGGRFILSSGCCLGRDTPPANVEAMVRAGEDFGAYE
jgi:uroporphyrinogen decarboxylase